MTLEGAIETAMLAAVRMDDAMYIIPEEDGWQVYQRPLSREQWEEVGTIIEAGDSVYLVTPDGEMVSL